MKKYIFLIPLVVLLSSCSTRSYFQICKVSSDIPSSQSGSYEYKNSDCDVTYNFWSNGGSVCFVITNNTDEILYVDLTKSFLVVNGFAYDYYLNRTTSTSAAIVTSNSTGTSATAQGYWNYFGKKVPGSISAISASSVSSQKSYSIFYEEKPIDAIPPHTSKIFSEYTVMSNRFKDCDLYESPSKNDQISMSFNRSTSPVSFTNSICYRVGNNNADQFIENSFYVSEVSNQHYKATIHKVKVGCQSDMNKKKEEVFIKTSPKEFFIPYKPRYQKKPQLGKKSNSFFNEI